MKSRLDIPTKQCNTVNGRFITVKDFPSSTAKWPKCSKLSGTDPKYIQNKSKIYAKRPCQEILDREYTNIYRHKDDKDTENFKIFLCALFILESLETTMTITWNKYSKHPLVPLLDYLHHTAETCRSGGVIPYYTHSS